MKWLHETLSQRWWNIQSSLFPWLSEESGALTAKQQVLVITLELVCIEEFLIIYHGGELDELTCLLESGSDRIGALNFQRSPTEYIPRSVNNVSMELLIESVERVEKGVSLTPELDQALFHGGSISGARPKALIQAQGKKYVAKFSSSADLYSVVKAEFVAMRLAALSGLNVAPVKRIKAANKDVLLIERFDRTKKDQGWSRKAMVSALTLLSLDDMMARYASYETFAEIIRHRFTDPKTTLKEVFSRLVFNLETSVEWDLECVDFDFRQGAMRRNNALLQRIAT